MVTVLLEHLVWCVLFFCEFLSWGHPYIIILYTNLYRFWYLSPVLLNRSRILPTPHTHRLSFPDELLKSIQVNF